MKKFELSESDKRSPFWLNFKAHLESELQVYRERNDSDLDAEATAKARGRIAMLKDLIRLGEPRKALPG